MSAHGTHVASILFGREDAGALGLAGRCRGLLLPVFADGRGYLSQLDLARAIERAVLEGAHIINVSGGERMPQGEADPILVRALNLCEQSNVMVVAAAGNDGCACLHVPAALRPSLAVGAMDREGAPLSSSNFGDAYRANGVLAPGEDVRGAVPGGGYAPMTGSSQATPMVTALAALLATEQYRRAGAVDAAALRDAILSSASPCLAADEEVRARYLAGTLDVRGAHAQIQNGERIKVTNLDPSHANPVVGASLSSEHISPDAAVSTAPPGEGDASPSSPFASTATEAAIHPAAGGHHGPTPHPPYATHPQPGMQGVTYGGYPGPAPFPYLMHPGAAPQPHAYAPSWTWGGPPAPGVQGSAHPRTGSIESCGCRGTAVSPCGCGGVTAASAENTAHGVSQSAMLPVVASPNGMAALPAPVPSRTVPVAPVPAALSLIFAIGNIGVDFGTEARRDTFRYLMREPRTQEGSVSVLTEANPHDPNQLYAYLDEYRHESNKVIWTLNLDLTPIYALEAEPAYAEQLYVRLRQALRGQAQSPDSDNYVSRISIPGILTTQTVQLFSGQVVPVVKVTRPAGVYLWNERALVLAVVESVNARIAAERKAAGLSAESDDAIRTRADRVGRKTRQMLDKVYYELRNLGQSPPDRALNFMATNAFTFARHVADGMLASDEVTSAGRPNVAERAFDLYSLDTITVVKSPYCRVDSDCWDVRLSFFDPDNDNRARIAFQTTVDVSDELPVQLSPTRQFLFAS